MHVARALAQLWLATPSMGQLFILLRSWRLAVCRLNGELSPKGGKSIKVYLTSRFAPELSVEHVRVDSSTGENLTDCQLLLSQIGVRLISQRD